MNIITKKLLEAEHYNGEDIVGTCLLRDVNKSLTKNGKFYYTGGICSGKEVTYRIWDNSTAFGVVDTQDLSGCIVNISGTWNEYQGQFSVVITSISKYEGDMGVDQFLPSPYNIKAYWEGLQKKAGSVLSDKAMTIANKVLFDNEEVSSLFKIEFAGKSHHDNVKGGLLAHTYKVFTIGCSVINMYGGIEDKDLILLGCLLHDIGKIKELNIGVYTNMAKVTHNFLGVEMLDKDLIVSLYGEDWYYELVSILLQHHGEFGMPCKTVSSRIVHIIDKFESELTYMKQLRDNSDNSGVIKTDAGYLHYMIGGTE